MRRQRLQLIVLIMALFILLNIIFVKAALLPLYYEKEQLDTENDQIRSDIRNLKKARPYIEDSYIVSQQQNLVTLIPAVPQVSQIYEDIDQAATEAEVFLREAYFPEKYIETDRLNPREKSIDLAVSGSYGDLMVFVHKIENTPRLLIINNISISRQQKAGFDYEAASEINSLGDQADHSMPSAYLAQLEIKYYYLPESGSEDYPAEN